MNVQKSLGTTYENEMQVTWLLIPASVANADQGHITESPIYAPLCTFYLATSLQDYAEHAFATDCGIDWQLHDHWSKQLLYTTS